MAYQEHANSDSETDEFAADAPALDVKLEIRNMEMLQLMRRSSQQRRRSSLADVIPEWPTLGVVDKPQYQLKVTSSFCECIVGIALLSNAVRCLVAKIKETKI